MVARALERGVRLFDTANVYDDGASERILGEALRDAKPQHPVHVATKVGLARLPGNKGKPEGLSRARVHAAVDESLSRLGLETVDLYYAHAPDKATPIDETVVAMGELIAQKKIARWGISNFASWQILEIHGRCDVLGVPRPVVSQVIYNLLIRQIEVEYLAFTRAHPIHTTVYNALAGGLLVGHHVPETGVTNEKPARKEDIPKGSRFDGNGMYQRRYWSARLFELVDAYRTVAREHGLTLVELSYAWLASREGIDSLLLGPGSTAHLDAAFDAVEKPLDAAVKKAIDAIHTGFLGSDARYAR